MKQVPSHIRARAAKLRQEIERHRYLYHVLDRQEISDAANDSLKHELSRLEAQYPELMTPDSPTQRIGGQPLPELKTVPHRQRMLSLNDVFSADELAAWEQRWQKLAPRSRSDYLVDLKLDGLAVSLLYERGLLVRAATRGDGATGEDVTHSIRTIESVPLRLRLDDLGQPQRRTVLNGTVEIRGEVVMLKRDFEALNRRQARAGKPVFANPRNVAAGSIRQLDPKLTASRKLRFYAWELVTDFGQPTLAASYELMRKLGVKVNPEAVVCPDIAAVQIAHARAQRQREQLPFWVDGVVVKVNDRELYQRLGVVGKSPRAAVAYKFPAEQATTVVDAIQVQVGRTGALTPVAHFRPVQLAGTTVARATLHNADEIKRLDVRVGDTVIIEKAGDIIPDVVQALTQLRPTGTKAFQMPKHCPVCRHPVRRKDGAVAHYCSNPTCPARAREALYHFASKKAFDIDGLGPNTIDVLVDEGLVSQPADFFELTAPQLIGLPLFAETKSKNLIAAIDAARRVSLNRFIFSLGIRHVGEQTAIDLAQHFHSIKVLMAADAPQLTVVPNIGSVVAKSIAWFFARPANQKRVERLLAAVSLLPLPRLKNAKLEGQTVVVTGALATISREEAHALIRAAGGTVGSAVSKQTAYLVVGDNPGSKLAAAERYGVPVIDEQTFKRMVE